jgi:hypothetical protein
MVLHAWFSPVLPGSPRAAVVIGHTPPKKKEDVEPTGKLLSSLFFLVEYKYFN